MDNLEFVLYLDGVMCDFEESVKSGEPVSEGAFLDLEVDLENFCSKITEEDTLYDSLHNSEFGLVPRLSELQQKLKFDEGVS